MGNISFVLDGIGSVIVPDNKANLAIELIQHKTPQWQRLAAERNPGDPPLYAANLVSALFAELEIPHTVSYDPVYFLAVLNQPAATESSLSDVESPDTLAPDADMTMEPVPLTPLTLPDPPTTLPKPRGGRRKTAASITPPSAPQPATEPPVEAPKDEAPAPEAPKEDMDPSAKEENKSTVEDAPAVPEIPEEKPQEEENGEDSAPIPELPDEDPKGEEKEPETTPEPVKVGAGDKLPWE